MRPSILLKYIAFCHPALHKPFPMIHEYALCFITKKSDLFFHDHLHDVTRFNKMLNSYNKWEDACLVHYLYLALNYYIFFQFINTKINK